MTIPWDPPAVSSGWTLEELGLAPADTTEHGGWAPQAWLPIVLPFLDHTAMHQCCRLPTTGGVSVRRGSWAKLAQMVPPLAEMVKAIVGAARWVREEGCINDR